MWGVIPMRVSHWCVMVASLDSAPLWVAVWVSVSSVLSSPYGRWSGGGVVLVWVPSDVSRICWGVSQWGRRC